MHDMTDEQLQEQHEQAVRIIARSVFGLVDKFAAQGVTPASVFEGALKGAIIALMERMDIPPPQIADLLDGAAEALREAEASEWQDTIN